MSLAVELGLLAVVAGFIAAKLRGKPSPPVPVKRAKSKKKAPSAPAEPIIEARESLLDVGDASLEDEEVTLLHGAAPQTRREIEYAQLLEKLTQKDDPSEPVSDSRIVISYEEEAEEEELTSPFARILVSARGDSDRGQKRRANEDSMLFLPERSLFAVADGMGGYAGGQVASSLAVETVRHAFEQESFVGDLRAEKPIPRRGRELACAMLQANWSVFGAARSDAALKQMGTTLVAARFSPNKQRVYIGHVGDSRCYRLRAGKLRQLTTDHTMRLVGLRGAGADDLFQAIGVSENLSIDLIVDKPRPDDIYLLCSDGLPKMASDEAIERILVEESDLEAAVYSLIELANDRGGKDNVTVVLVKVIERAVRNTLNELNDQHEVRGKIIEPAATVSSPPGSDDMIVIGPISLGKTKVAESDPAPAKLEGSGG